MKGPLPTLVVDPLLGLRIACDTNALASLEVIDSWRSEMLIRKIVRATWKLGV